MILQSVHHANLVTQLSHKQLAVIIQLYPLSGVKITDIRANPDANAWRWLLRLQSLMLSDMHKDN